MGRPEAWALTSADLGLSEILGETCFFFSI